MTGTRVIAALVVTAASAATAAPAPRVSRAELDDIRLALEKAVSAVSRPAGVMSGGGGHAYHLKGYGAVVVLAPRALPRVRRFAGGPDGFDDVLRDVERSIAEIRDPAERRRLRETVAALRNGSLAGMPMPISPPRPRLAMPRHEIEALQEEAEAFRREATRAMEKAERDIIVRLRLPEDALPALPPPPPVPRVAVVPPTPRVAPVPPMPPAAAVPRTPVVPRTPPARPAPPIVASPPAAETMVADVRRAIVAGLSGYRGDLATVGPEEFVVVALDFLPGFADRSGAQTIVARARKRDLAAHRAGRLSSDAFRARVEFDQY